MPGSGSQHVVPRRLPVVVGVHVDPTRGHEQAVGVDDLTCGDRVQLTDSGDEAPVDRYVGRPLRTSGAVDDGATPNDEIVHAPPPGRSGAAIATRTIVSRTHGT